jgi:hypothetical protein
MDIAYWNIAVLHKHYNERRIIGMRLGVAGIRTCVADGADVIRSIKT